jgi:hypothetical protein
MAAETGKQEANMGRKFIPESTKAFLFIGTPHLGSSITIFGKFQSLIGFWSGASTTLLEVIEPGSSENNRLHDAFMKEHGRDNDKAIVNIFEVRPEFIGPFQFMHVSI